MVLGGRLPAEIRWRRSLLVLHTETMQVEEEIHGRIGVVGIRDKETPVKTCVFRQCVCTKDYSILARLNTIPPKGAAGVRKHQPPCTARLP